MAETGVPKSHEVGPMTFMDLATKRVLKITSDPKRTEDALTGMGVYSVSWTNTEGQIYTTNHAIKDEQDPFINVNISVRKNGKLEIIDSMVWDPADPTNPSTQSVSTSDSKELKPPRRGFEEYDYQKILGIILAIELGDKR